MEISFTPHTQNHVTMVREFNARLRNKGVDIAFPESPISSWLPPIEGRKLYQQHFLAVDDQAQAIRGAYILKPQEFTFQGNNKIIAHLTLPISEGIIDRRFYWVGIGLLNDALTRQPLLFTVGMGGHDQPLSRMLKAMGWTLFTVPFFFRVIHSSRFFKNLTLFKKTRLRKFLVEILRLTGAGSVALYLTHRAAQGLRAEPRQISGEIVPSFGKWADALWQACQNEYAMSAVRDSVTLNTLYPNHGGREFLRLRVYEGGKTIGWAVMLDTQMSSHNHFADMRVGSIIDCMANHKNAAKTILGGTRFLERRGVDMIISNQSSAVWGTALRRAGFLCGPSNFIFAGSPALSKELDPFARVSAQIHLNRGDGDGPIHL